MMRFVTSLITLTLVLATRAQKDEERKLGCFDRNSVSDCEFMRDFDFCEEDIRALKTRCDKTCGWCSESEQCVDRAAYLDCAALTRAECNNNVTFYISRCRKSCKWCGKSKPSVWGPWTRWSVCPNRCTNRKSQRTRECQTGSCSGAAIQQRLCNRKCPTWSRWGPWSSCSATCDEGGRFRSRTCRNDQNRRCRGESIETDMCELQPCSSSSKDWRPWGEWSGCSESCGRGYTVRRRSCTSRKCQGPTIDYGACTVTECPTWGEWGHWTSCSVTCGKGEKSRMRKCKSDFRCTGRSNETVTCKLPSCSGLGLQFDVWTPCSKSCGAGTRIKLNKCPEMDADICPKEYQDCNTFPCRFKICRNYHYDGRRGSYSSCCKNEPATCGKNIYNSITQRIVQGEISLPKQFPWMARLEVMGGQAGPFVMRHICGGTLIHPQYVVTAAHCFELVFFAARLRVILGSISRADTSTYVQVMEVANFSLHGNYSKPVHDIGIIKLKKPVVITQYVRPICLPNGEETPIDAKCFVAGWGLTYFSNTHPSTNLMQAKVRHLPFDLCKQAYKPEDYDKYMDESRMMCGGNVAGGTDTCDGDSGGPIMCQRCSTCSWYLAGVTSFGDERCGSAYRPGVYTRVIFYEDWITSLVEPLETTRFSCPT